MNEPAPLDPMKYEKNISIINIARKLTNAQVYHKYNIIQF